MGEAKHHPDTNEGADGIADDRGKREQAITPERWDIATDKTAYKHPKIDSSS
jgi:hypothetical protein